MSSNGDTSPKYYWYVTFIFTKSLAIHAIGQSKRMIDFGSMMIETSTSWVPINQISNTIGTQIKANTVTIVNWIKICEEQYLEAKDNAKS